MEFPGNLQQLLQQAQNLQQNIAQAQNELKEKTVAASAGGGMVEVVANGAQEILSVTIDPQVVNQNEITMLQDLIQAATNEALRRVREMSKQEMMKHTAGFPLPPIF